MKNTNIDFLDIKKGKVKFDYSCQINSRIKEVLFPNEKSTKDFYKTYEGKLHYVLNYVGDRIFNHNDVEVSTWYPLNGKDTHSLVEINYDKIINYGVEISIDCFTNHLERKIKEHSNLKNLRLDKSIELIKISTSTLLESKFIICKILFNKYWNIVFDDSTLNYSSNDVNHHIKEEWENSIEIEELEVKFKEKVDELCSSSIYSKSESQKIIIDYSLQNVINELNLITSDSHFKGRFIRFNELNESKLDLEKIKSLI